MEGQQQLTQKQNFIQVIKFTIISISAGLVEMAVFALLNDVIHLGSYWVCYLPALICSVLWNFTINRRYTFKSANNIKIAMLKVFLFYCAFTPLSTWWGDALEGAGWHEWLVLAFTMIINFVTEFLYCRFFVYRNQMNNNDVAKRDEEKAKMKVAKASEDSAENQK